MVSCEKHDYGSMKESCCPICLSEQINLTAIFRIIDDVDFELSQLEDIAKGEIGEKITLLRKYIDENRISA